MANSVPDTSILKELKVLLQKQYKREVGAVMHSKFVQALTEMFLRAPSPEPPEHPRIPPGKKVGTRCQTITQPLLPMLHFVLSYRVATDQSMQSRPSPPCILSNVWQIFLCCDAAKKKKNRRRKASWDTA